MGKIPPEILSFHLERLNISQTKLANLLKIKAPSVNRYVKQGVPYEKFEEIGKIIGMPDAEIATVIQAEIKKSISAFDNFENKGSTSTENGIGFVLNEPSGNYGTKEISEPHDSISKQLVDLANLFKQGFLTQEEFSEAKSRVLKI